jgi:hypothetical protein
MKAEKVYRHVNTTQNGPDDDFYYIRTCIACVARAAEITEDQARYQVLGILIEHKKKRAEKFQQVMTDRKEEYEVMGLSRQERRRLTLDSMDELFEPLAQFIVRKQEAMERVVKDVARHKELVLQLALCKSVRQEHEILAEMEKLEIDDQYLAFADKGAQQHEYILASSYSDEWTRITNKKGETIAGICSWYVCCALTAWDPITGANTKCLSVLPSKDWARKFADPMAPKQKWYCKCGASYKATWGQLVEISRVNSSGQLEKFYMRNSTWDVEDVRATSHEVEMAPTVPTALYDNLKRVEPTLTSIVVLRDDHKRIVDLATWTEMPKFQWTEIFALAGARAPPGAR